MGTQEIVKSGMVFCRGCGKEIHYLAPTCPTCGAIQVVQQQPLSASDKRILPALLLCWFLGVFGAHRFYVGKTGTAVAQLFTLGGLGIWALVDLIMIICGVFTDGAGNKITLWT